MEERRLGSDLKLYNFNIVREDPYISRVITRQRWEDGQRVSYDTLVWGKPDDLDNKFPDTAEDEGPGDADADEPVPVDGGSLIPSAIADKAAEAINASILAAESVKTQVAGLLGSQRPDDRDGRELCWCSSNRVHILEG